TGTSGRARTGEQSRARVLPRRARGTGSVRGETVLGRRDRHLREEYGRRCGPARQRCRTQDFPVPWSTTPTRTGWGLVATAGRLSRHVRRFLYPPQRDGYAHVTANLTAREFSGLLVFRVVLADHSARVRVRLLHSVHHENAFSLAKSVEVVLTRLAGRVLAL